MINFKILCNIVLSTAMYCCLLQPAFAFNDSVIQSVVSVLPKWPDNAQRGGGNGRPEAPEGTAIAVFPDGYLLTNAHVLGAATDVDIRLNDGRILSVDIIGRDLRTDLALLKAPKKFPVLQPGVPPKLGDQACSVGNQFGLGLSVTCGVVSATHRTGTGFNVVEDFVQTDAVVNPGGSGGALVDKSGKLIGMISAIFTKSNDANIGINFATSTVLLMRVAEDLRDHGRVLWGQSGMRVGALTTEERRQSSGAKVIHVSPDGNAKTAGIERGDIITKVGERSIYGAADVASAMALYRQGNEVVIVFSRANQTRNVTITLK